MLLSLTASIWKFTDPLQAYGNLHEMERKSGRRRLVLVRTATHFAKKAAQTKNRTTPHECSEEGDSHYNRGCSVILALDGCIALSTGAMSLRQGGIVLKNGIISLNFTPDMFENGLIKNKFGTQKATLGILWLGLVSFSLIILRTNWA